MPLAARALSLFGSSALAFVATIGARATDALAFDKQTCASAYETAQQLRADLKMRRAREQLLVCGHSTCPSVVTTDCNAWLKEVDQSLSSVVFHAVDRRGQPLTDVRVSMDGELLRDHLDDIAVMVDPGQHTFRFDADGIVSFEVEQMLRRGERGRPIDVTLQPREEDLARAPEPARVTSVGAPPEKKNDAERPASPAPTDWTSVYVTSGVGVVALSSFAFFGVMGTSDAKKLRDTCAPTCPDADVSAARTKLVAANISLGVGIAALGVAGILLLTQGANRSPAKSAFSLDLRPAALGAGAEFAATFVTP